MKRSTSCRAVIERPAFLNAFRGAGVALERRTSTWFNRRVKGFCRYADGRDGRVKPGHDGSARGRRSVIRGLGPRIHTGWREEGWPDQVRAWRRGEQARDEENVIRAPRLLFARMAGSSPAMTEKRAGLAGGGPGWLYRLRVLTGYRGMAESVVEVYTTNNAARFPMLKRYRYLVFAYRKGGRLVVSSCGNSAMLSRARAALKQIEELTEYRRSGGAHTSIPAL